MSWDHIRNPSFPPFLPPRMEERRSSSETSLLSKGQTPTSAILGTLLLYLKKTRVTAAEEQMKLRCVTPNRFCLFEDKEKKRIQHLIMINQPSDPLLRPCFISRYKSGKNSPLSCMYRRFMLLFLNFYLHELSLLNDKFL